YGAIADDNMLDTKAIQQAIDACEKNGGGTVIIESGTFDIGTITLKNKVSVFFETGAMLQGSPRLDDYTGEKKALIYGNTLSNVSISGMGVIDGSGATYWDDDFKALDRPEPWILLKNCNNLRIRDIKFQNSPSHTIRLETSDNIKFEGISIINPHQGPNTDGIDIVDSKNVFVSNSYISTGDDAICLKSQKDTVENVVVTNCVLESDDAAIKFGTGSHMATRYCTFSNNVIKKTRYGISLFMLDGGVFEHNNFSNIIIENGSRHTHQYPIFMDIDKKTPERNYGIVRNNTFSNITAVTDGKILISGHEQSRIENLIIDGLRLTVANEADFSQAKKPRGNKNYPKLATSVDLAPKSGVLTFGYINGLRLNDIQLYSSSKVNKEALYLEEVQDLENTNFKGFK
ncbi:MAG: glycosyl hydrolase family 28 protein, partial [Bacteroidota bacterium]